ncbi:cytochrome oxidase putative small subunit CydP [Ralstonia sp. 25C]|uniref:cytochrome oxidase putative small subunit CydP n=1 Tax=Ralstonia sp. 25C TaxID=3447363 RepID=UPI003F753739
MTSCDFLAAQSIARPVSPNDRRLVRHLLIVVTLKVAVLAALWWVFVRDVRVPVDAERAADRLAVTPPAQGGHP